MIKRLIWLNCDKLSQLKPNDVILSCLYVSIFSNISILRLLSWHSHFSTIKRDLYHIFLLIFCSNRFAKTLGCVSLRLKSAQLQRKKAANEKSSTYS